VERLAGAVKSLAAGHGATRDPRHTPVSGHGADAEHDAQVHAGVQELVTLDQPYAKEGIKKVQAEAIAARVHREHPVFKSISVVDGGDRWDYEYVATVGHVTGVYKEYLERAQGHFTAAHGKATFTQQDLASFLGLGLNQAKSYSTAWAGEKKLFYCDWAEAKLTFDPHLGTPKYLSIPPIARSSGPPSRKDGMRIYFHVP